MSTVIKNFFSYEDPFWQKVDFYVFATLVLSVTLYQLQNLDPFFLQTQIRILLYAYLYLRVCFFYKIELNKALVLSLTFLLVCFAIGVHTYFTYSYDLALHAYCRFVNVALLAPLAMVLVRTREKAKVIIFLWSTVTVLGFLTVLYQLFIGDMKWLVKDYIAIRGDLIRHKSLLGEPNVGAMASVILYTIGFLFCEKKWLRYFSICISVLLIILSISKAAYLAFLIINFFLLVFCFYTFLRSGKKVLINFGLNYLVIICFSLLIFQNKTIQDYGKVGKRAFLGEQFGEPGALEDLNNRLILQRYGINDDGIGFSPKFYFGHSFKAAGSAALEMKVPGAVGPHNTYLEIYIVGGILTLILFLILISKNAWTLARISLKTNSYFFTGLLIIYVILCLFMVGYPVIYEPISGSLFWLIVGFAGVPWVYEEDILRP